MISESDKQLFAEAPVYKITIYNYDGEMKKQFHSAHIINRISKGSIIRWQDINTGKRKYYDKGILDSVLVEEV